MGARGSSRESSGESEPRTLADILYARTSPSARVPEKYWGDLVKSMAAGDQVALHALYAQTHRLVFTLIARIIGNRETAEEVTVDVFHDLWRRAPSYDPARGPVVGWIMNQARCRAIDRLRYEQRKKRVGDRGTDLSLMPAASGPQQAIDAREQGRLLRQALEVLSSEERQAIETAYFEELTYSEAAARLNQPLGTVKTRIRSGLGKLRQALAGTLKGP